MIQDILFVLWFFLPAGLGNVAPILVAKLPYLRTLSFPLDCYATFRNRRILGNHKTLRGLISGMLMGVLVVYLEVFLYAKVPFVKTFVSIDYLSINPVLFGLLSSVGALTGDAVKSFFKRQVGIAPGKSWFPFDQVDFIVGGIVFTAFYIQLTLWQYALLCIVWFVLDLLATYVGYYMMLKDSPI